MKNYHAPRVSQVGNAAEVINVDKIIHEDDSITGGIPADYTPLLSVVDMDD